MNLIQTLEKDLGKPTPPAVRIGDTVEVHYMIKEGEKERIQLFIGTVIAVQGRGVRRSVTVRRIVQGEGVERTFPLHNPRVKDIVSTRRGTTRRSKLYFLRDRVGKMTRLKELLEERGEESVDESAAPAPVAPGAAPAKSAPKAKVRV
jgi:large subunit ribosomal protein L19